MVLSDVATRSTSAYYTQVSSCEDFFNLCFLVFWASPSSPQHEWCCLCCVKTWRLETMLLWFIRPESAQPASTDLNSHLIRAYTFIVQGCVWWMRADGWFENDEFPAYLLFERYGWADCRGRGKENSKRNIFITSSAIFQYIVMGYIVTCPIINQFSFYICSFPFKLAAIYVFVCVYDVWYPGSGWALRLKIEFVDFHRDWAIFNWKLKCWWLCSWMLLPPRLILLNAETHTINCKWQNR